VSHDLAPVLVRRRGVARRADRARGLLTRRIGRPSRARAFRAYSSMPSRRACAVAIAAYVLESRMLSESLREQASALRVLATYFKAHLIRDDLLRLAKRCEELADEIEREIKGHGSISC